MTTGLLISNVKLLIAIAPKPYQRYSAVLQLLWSLLQSRNHVAAVSQGHVLANLHCCTSVYSPAMETASIHLSVWQDAQLHLFLEGVLHHHAQQTSYKQQRVSVLGEPRSLNYPGDMVMLEVQIFKLSLLAQQYLCMLP